MHFFSVQAALGLHLIWLLLCRIDDLEDVVNINERLNQQLHQKDERITVLQTKYVLLYCFMSLLCKNLCLSPNRSFF